MGSLSWLAQRELRGLRVPYIPGAHDVRRLLFLRSVALARVSNASRAGESACALAWIPTQTRAKSSATEQWAVGSYCHTFQNIAISGHVLQCTASRPQGAAD